LQVRILRLRQGPPLKTFSFKKENLIEKHDISPDTAVSGNRFFGINPFFSKKGLQGFLWGGAP